MELTSFSCLSSQTRCSIHPVPDCLCWILRKQSLPFRFLSTMFPFLLLLNLWTISLSCSSPQTFYLRAGTIFYVAWDSQLTPSTSPKGAPGKTLTLIPNSFGSIPVMPHRHSLSFSSSSSSSSSTLIPQKLRKPELIRTLHNKWASHPGAILLNPENSETHPNCPPLPCNASFTLVLAEMGWWGASEQKQEVLHLQV